MKKTSAIALALIVCGAAIIFAALAANDFELTAFSTVKYESFEYECSGEIRGIEIDEGSQDITIRKSDGAMCRLEYFTTGKDSYTIEESDGVLRITHDDNGQWLSVNFGDAPGMTIYLPEGAYDRLCVRSNSGDILICEGAAFAEADIGTASGDVEVKADVRKLEVSADSGEISVWGCTLGDFTATTTSGDIEVEKAEIGAARLETSSGSADIERVKLEGELEVSTASGDVELEYVEAAGISVENMSGDVSGIIEAPMCYEVETASGDVRVPAAVWDGAPCRIKTASGDIEIETGD